MSPGFEVSGATLPTKIWKKILPQQLLKLLPFFCKVSSFASLFCQTYRRTQAHLDKMSTSRKLQIIMQFPTAREMHVPRTDVNQK